MRDRGGWEYLVGFDVAKDGTLSVPTHALSRARAERRESGLSGRQWKRYIKQSRRNVKRMVTEAKRVPVELEGLVSGEQG